MPDAIPEAAAELEAWLAEGRHGDMAWMADRAGRRADPRTLWPAVRSIVMLGMNYGPDSDPLATLAHRDAATISVYARHRDYHDVIKGKLKELAGALVAAAGDAPEVKVFVDTAPVMEKPLAAAAGLGWVGKHTNLLSAEFGSWLFLGSIFTTAEIEPDAPQRPGCGTCRACLDACPTGAFTAPYRLDARRCISYLTIEHKGHIDRALRPLMGNRIYGCDDCLAVCPWNKFAVEASEAKLRARADRVAPSLGELARLDDAGFRATFSGSPVKRIGIDRFLRNLLIAIGNSDNDALLPRALDHLRHRSELVRAMAVWAAGRLVGLPALRGLAPDAWAAETDPAVRAEWEQL